MMAQPVTAEDRHRRAHHLPQEQRQQRLEGRGKETAAVAQERQNGRMAAQNPCKSEYQLIHIPSSLSLAPHLATTASASSNRTGVAGGSVSAARGSSGRRSSARSRGSSGNSRRSPVARLTMTQHGRVATSIASTATRKSTAAGSSAKLSRNSSSSSRDLFSNWGARSKLPFHMLPFEVQAYHLQQQLIHQQSDLHHHPSDEHSLSVSAHGSSSSNCHSSSSSLSSSEAPSLISLPVERAEAAAAAATVAAAAAAAESAWFPLMPPAIAGEASPPTTTNTTQRSRTEGNTVAAAGGFKVGPRTTNCQGVLDAGAATTATVGSVGRQHYHQQQQQGLERCWETMTGDVVHATASLGSRRSYVPSAATIAAACPSPEASSSSCRGPDGGEEGLPPFSVPSSMPAAAGSFFARRSDAHTPLRKASGGLVAPAHTREAATAAAAAKAMALAVHSRHAAAGRLVFGGVFSDDDSGAGALLAGTNKALTLAALSGFVEGGGATRFQEVSIDLSNACRAFASWSLRLAGEIISEDQDDDDEERVEDSLPPPQLVYHVFPEPTPELPDANGKKAAAAAAGGGGAKGRTFPVTTTSSSRLQPRRSITRVTIEGNAHAVTSASWPSTMKRLEFGTSFNSPIEGVRLPEGLEVVRFGARFNQPVSRARWPATLRELTFGNDFNQPVSGMALPAGVRRLDFGGRFNFSISAVDFPEELREVRFGHGFNREMSSNVRWPPHLSKLEFFGELQQRVEDVFWPRTLTHLALLGDFEQPINAVTWPPGLTTVRFGDRFQQPLTGWGTRWPSGLEKIIVSRGYGMSLRGPVWTPSRLAQSERYVLLRGGGGGGGVDLVAERMGAPPPGLPPSCEVLRVLNTENQDEDENDGVCTGAGTKMTMTLVQDEAAALQMTTTTTMMMMMDGQDSPRPPAAGEGGAAVAVLDLRPALDGVDADQDESYYFYWGEDDWNKDEDEWAGFAGLTGLEVLGPTQDDWPGEASDPRARSHEAAAPAPSGWLRSASPGSCFY
ncbi:unnamed protein product [Pylaiella littoralis]